MRQTMIFLAVLLLTLVVYVPAPGLADEREDLEATITVLDDPADLDDSMRQIKSPDVRDVEDEESDTEDSGDEPKETIDDGFELDDVYDDDEMVYEDDFEEAEDIDEDTYDEDAP